MLQLRNKNFKQMATAAFHVHQTVTTWLFDSFKRFNKLKYEYKLI